MTELRGPIDGGDRCDFQGSLQAKRIIMKRMKRVPNTIPEMPPGDKFESEGLLRGEENVNRSFRVLGENVVDVEGTWTYP